MNRTIVAGEVDEEAFDGLGTQAVNLEDPMHIEEIARVLAIQRGADFAAVEFRHGQYWHAESHGEQVARGFDERSRFRW